VFHYCGKLVRWPKREAPLLAKAPGKNETIRRTSVSVGNDIIFKSNSSCLSCSSLSP
jgi:hypothetical protein